MYGTLKCFWFNKQGLNQIFINQAHRSHCACNIFLCLDTISHVYHSRLPPPTLTHNGPAKKLLITYYGDNNNQDVNVSTIVEQHNRVRTVCVHECVCEIEVQLLCLCVQWGVGISITIVMMFLVFEFCVRLNSS